MPKRTKRAETKDETTVDTDAAESLTAAINAPPDPTRAKAFREQYRDVFCPTCGTLRTADACPVDGHRFGGDA